ncbi:unnamed protein product [Rotaria sp. Silwood1]|nr:unnamed protein product [Rotaria sp. Silwood1]
MTKVAVTSMSNQQLPFCSVNHFLYSLIRSSRVYRRGLITQLLKMFDNDSSNTLSSSSSSLTLEEQLFVADNLAYFPYQVQDEPLFIVEQIDLSISVIGSTQLQQFRDLLKQHLDYIDDDEGIDMNKIENKLNNVSEIIIDELNQCLRTTKPTMLLLLLKSYLKDVYYLNDTKIIEYDHTESTKITDRPILTRKINIKFEPKIILDTIKPININDPLQKRKQIIKEFADFKRYLLAFDMDIEDTIQSISELLPTSLSTSKGKKKGSSSKRRAENIFHSQSDAGHMFESYQPHSTYSTSASLQNLHYSPYRQQRISPPKFQPSYTTHLSQSQSFPSELDNVLRTSTNSKILHKNNDFERQTIQQSNIHKIPKHISKDNYSLTNGRLIQQRSTSASNSLTTRYQDLPSSHYLNSNDSQRLKHVVRHVESSAHTSSGLSAKTNLITSEPIVAKKSSSISQQEKLLKKKPITEIINKRIKTDIEESLNYTNQRTEKIFKSKRDTTFEIFDEKRSISSPPTVTRTTKTDLLLHNRSKSTNYFQDESSISDESSIHRKDTELTKKDTNTSSNSTQQRQSDVVTSDASDLERRVRAYREQLKAKKFELEKLKQRKNKEILRRQEDELKKQIESCDYEIQTLRLQPIQQEQTVPIPSPYIHSNTSSPSTERKKSNLSKSDKQILSPKQNIFEERPLETPRDERDTQDDALSISVTTDLPNEFEIDHDSQHININNDKQITDVNIYSSILSKEKEDSISSSSITSEKHTISLSPRISRSPSPPPPPLAQEPIKSPLPSVHEYIKSSSSLVEERLKTLSQEQIFVPINELKQSEHSSINSEYGEDFSEVSHSPIHTSVKIQTNDIESIEDDIHNKSLKHDSNKSSSSKTSDDEQSEILVLNIKSTNNILEQQDNKDKLSTLPSQTLLISKKIESDNTTHDINENDQGNKHLEQDNKIDKLTEILVRTFIDEAIEHGKQIENLKIQNSLTKEASEWIPAEDVISEENNKQILTNHEEEIDNEIPTFSKEPDGLDQSDTTTNETNDDVGKLFFFCIF